MEFSTLAPILTGEVEGCPSYLEGDGEILLSSGSSDLALTGFVVVAPGLQLGRQSI